MNDLETINRVIEHAVESSSYITVLISSGVFILYTLIIKLVDLYKAKNRDKPIVEMATAIKEISENVLKLNSVLDKIFADAETKEANKVKSVIVLAFDSFRANISKYCTDVIIHNNINADIDLIRQNIYRTISTEYYKLYSVFSAYEINGVNIATKIKESWIDDITKECTDIIYDGQAENYRISQINNRLQITANEYSIFINNKVFN